MAKLGQLHKEALTQFEDASEIDRQQRRLAIQDMLFLNAEDGQWSDDATEKRKDRPRYTIDRISSAKDQVVGNQRQTRMGIKVIPQKNGEKDIARIYSGLIRSIENFSNAQNAYDNGFDESLTGGFGGWSVISEFEGDESFDQCLKIKPIHSAASSLYFDPASIEYDKSDAKFAFLVKRMPLAQFQKEWPEASQTDFTQEQFKQGTAGGWFTNNSIRIADYWYKEIYTQKVGLLSDGRVIDLDDEAKVLDELAISGTRVVRERNVDAWKVKIVVMNGAEVLTEPQDWPGIYIPLVPIYGRQAIINGERYTRGLVRKAIDAQRVYNYATSAAIEATALTPKDPIWITAMQSKGFERELKNFPAQNSPFMRYNPDPASPGPPQRTGAPSLQTALLQQISQAASDIHATTGLEPASLGNVPELKSGRAIEAQQNMGDRGTFIFQDNLRKSLRYTGQILVDLIPRIYDTERVVQILGEDDTSESITVNQHSTTSINEAVTDRQTGEQVLVNDLSQGKYAVEVTTGLSLPTQRRETVNQLVDLAASSPVVQEVGLDLIIENMDINKADELKKRIRKRMIMQGIVEPTDEERKELGLDQPQQPDPMQMSIKQNLDAQTENLQMKNEKLISDIQKQDAEIQQTIIASQQKTIDAFVTLRDSLLQKAQEGIPVTPQDIELLLGQVALAEETQTNVLKHSEIAGSMPAGAPQISPNLTNR